MAQNGFKIKKNEFKVPEHPSMIHNGVKWPKLILNGLKWQNLKNTLESTLKNIQT